MKHFMLLTFLLFNIMPVYSMVKVESVKVYKDFAFSAYTPAEAFALFVNSQQYSYEYIHMDDSEINVVESLINNAALKYKCYGRDLGTAKGMSIYMAMIVRIDSTDHYFIVRDRSILTEVLKGNVKRDYIFLNEKQKMVLGNLAMKYSASIKYGYKNPIGLPVSIDKMMYYSNTSYNVNASNVRFFFETPERYVNNPDLVSVDERDMELFETMINNAKEKKHWNRITEGSWERSKKVVLPIVVTVDSLDHNFVLLPEGEMIELVDGGEVFYNNDKSERKKLAELFNRLKGC